MSIEQEAYDYQTLQHIVRVRDHLNTMIKNLLIRGEKHDQSKLRPPENEGFRLSQSLFGMTYGSPEFLESKKKLEPILAHHYANNRHHPEHFRNGVSDMNLIDVLEMFCDWKASSERHHDGNLRKSIEINAPRFQLSPQLVQILMNSIDLVE